MISELLQLGTKLWIKIRAVVGAAVELRCAVGVYVLEFYYLVGIQGGTDDVYQPEANTEASA